MSQYLQDHGEIVPTLDALSAQHRHSRLLERF